MIQLDGSLEDSVYTALAKIPGADEEAAPLAEIRLTFHESVAEEVSLGALINTFINNVDSILERLDEARALDAQS
jgi:hypothetical protein